MLMVLMPRCLLRTNVREGSNPGVLNKDVGQSVVELSGDGNRKEKKKGQGGREGREGREGRVGNLRISHEVRLEFRVIMMRWYKFRLDLGQLLKTLG